MTFSKVTHSTFSDDYIYLALPLPYVTVNVESDDVAKVLVSESALEVSEDGSLVAQYFLQLNSEPLAGVKIVVLPWLDSNSTNCYRFGLCNLTLPVTEFLFTPQNWNVQQTVVVRATDDNLDEYDTHMTGISHLSYSEDPKYNAISLIPTINVKVVVLASEPFANVTTSITNVGTVGNYAVASPTQLAFTWRNWNVSQTVSVAAFDDHTQDTMMCLAWSCLRASYVRQKVTQACSGTVCVSRLNLGNP
ncbi:hypothetical protein BBI17_006650 [Phytophthora kernoviae]|nr:hypothetical protein G195_007254 [Phytophthora kernoviae 00238/432]KAG2521428.1 hypothetical protein JM16_006211 [Phytophthora kernoviae]KAG2522558.1 hypothetical protein JM18_006040 [Phytophthora kernoviae]RLN14906.1 hypothetical protein BBI17_006650 [Phytophthora kernoviae]